MKRAGASLQAAVHDSLDRLGVIVSGACAVHCVVWPLAFALLPVLTTALRSFQHPWHDVAIWAVRLSSWEPWIVATAIGIGLAATGAGWRRHRAVRPLLLALGGSAILVGGMLLRSPQWVSIHAWVACAGGALLVWAHVTNLQAGRLARQPLDDQPATGL